MGVADPVSSALVKPLPNPAPVYSSNGTVGAVVVGGDYQGLGIVRSLGRQGRPLVCVVDGQAFDLPLFALLIKLREGSRSAR